jgi:hypothetical protein
MIIFEILAIIWTFRLVTNIFRLYATKYYFYRFKKQYKNLDQYARPVEVLFKKADTQHIVISTDRRISLKQIYQNKISNCLTDPSSYQKLYEVFENTIGVYKYRIRQNFYPTFWLTIPINILNSIGVQPNIIVSTLINILFWLVSFLAGYFLEKFLDYHIPTSLFSNLDKLIG